MGRLVMEIATELMESCKGDINNVLKSPQKITSTIKRFTAKIEAMVRAGEINEKEATAEMKDLMEKLKDIPEMQAVTGMLSQMGLGNLSNLGGLGGLGGLGKNLGGRPPYSVKRRTTAATSATSSASAAPVTEPLLSEEELLELFSRPSITPNNSSDSNSGKSAKKNRKKRK